jgi:hypothetical protein
MLFDVPNDVLAIQFRVMISPSPVFSGDSFSSPSHMVHEIVLVAVGGSDATLENFFQRENNIKQMNDLEGDGRGDSLAERSLCAYQNPAHFPYDMLMDARGTITMVPTTQKGVRNRKRFGS